MTPEERVMLTNLSKLANRFFEDEQNQLAYEKWKEERRKANADHDIYGPDCREPR